MALLLGGFLLLCGCQATPEKAIVQGKDQAQLLDTAKDNETGKTIAEMLSAPDHPNELGKYDLYAQSDHNLRGNISVQAGNK